MQNLFNKINELICLTKNCTLTWFMGLLINIFMSIIYERIIKRRFMSAIVLLEGPSSFHK